ncbi:MAG: response regulator, partial [Bacteroidia bacterium]|nr:response regulator [Bacteroidia bacterium]
MAEAQKFKDADATKAISFANQAIQLSTKENSPTTTIKAYLLLGRIIQDKNELPEAYNEYHQALNIALSLKDSQLISKCYHNIGDVYKTLGMFGESVHYLHLALKIAQLSHDTADISAGADRLGHVHMDEGERTGNKKFFEQALKHYNYSLEINKKRNDPRRLCISYVNLANAHLIFLKHGADTSNAGTSIAYSLEGIKIADENKIVDEKAISLLNMGEAFLQLKEYEKALTYFANAFTLYKSLNKKLWEAATLRDMALAFEGQKEIDNAIAHVERANAIAQEFNHAEQPDNYLLLSELYGQKKNFEKSLQAYKKYEHLLNMERNTKSTLELEKMQMQSETELKDKEIVYLNEERKHVEDKVKKDNIIIAVMSGAILLVIIISILLFNRSRLLQRSKDLSDKARIMQEQFLANTSHEIRTPMNGIIGMANQLMSSELTAEQKEYVRVMIKSSNNLLSIINDLLDLSKIKAGKLEFFPKEFDSKLFFLELYTLMKARAKEKGIELNFLIDKKLPVVLIADELRLEQILLNLLDNALKFTEKGKVELSVNVKEKPGVNCILEFKVSDTGSGIPADKTHTIFESFVQLENPGQRKHGGTGLGLSIVKFMIESLGGKISVKSEEGKGTAFDFFLPVKTGKSVSATNATSLPERKNLEFASILIVEDNSINQKVIESTLMKWNCQFTIAQSAVECFDELSQADYDIILMDIELPDISGTEAAKYIRQKFSGTKKNIPIIALTAYAYETERIKYIEAGMNEVVVKPFSEDELYAKIVSLLNKNSEISFVSNQTNSQSGNSLYELSQRYKDEPEEFKTLLELF